MDVQIPVDNLQLIQDLKQGQYKIDDRIRDAQIFKLLVASVKDYAIFMLDPKGYIVTWNDGAQRAKGYTADRNHRPPLFYFLYERCSIAGAPSKRA